MRILCFGDSNTYGWDPRSYLADRYAPGDRWPELLGLENGWEVVNLGLNGRQIPRSPYPPRLFDRYKPVDRFLIMLGTNDLLQGASARQAAGLMEASLKKTKPRRKLLLIAPPPMKRGAWVPTDALVEEAWRLAECYSLVARTLDIPFADTRDWDLELAFDGVHLTENGHHVFAARMGEFLKKLDFAP